MLTGHRLVLGVKGVIAVRGVGQHDHGRAAGERLHHSEQRVGAHECALSHDDGRPAGGPPVRVGHDRRALFVTNEDRAHRLPLVPQGVEDSYRSAAGQAEYEFDPCLVQHVGNHVSGYSQTIPPRNSGNVRRVKTPQSDLQGSPYRT